MKYLLNQEPRNNFFIYAFAFIFLMIVLEAGVWLQSDMLIYVAGGGILLVLILSFFAWIDKSEDDEL